LKDTKTELERAREALRSAQNTIEYRVCHNASLSVRKLINIQGGEIERLREELKKGKERPQNYATLISERSCITHDGSQFRFYPVVGDMMLTS
jgi:hypothetical protein